MLSETVDDEDRIDSSLLQIWKLSFGHKAVQTLRTMFGQGLKLKFRQGLKLKFGQYFAAYTHYSTLGSVVPLAMFHSTHLFCYCHRQVILELVWSEIIILYAAFWSEC